MWNCIHHVSKITLNRSLSDFLCLWESVRLVQFTWVIIIKMSDKTGQCRILYVLPKVMIFIPSKVYYEKDSNKN